MISADPPLRSDEPVDDPSEDELDNDLSEEEMELPEDEAADELSEETGIDLSDASELDADNVPADEEFDRVVQAPD